MGVDIGSIIGLKWSLLCSMGTMTGLGHLTAAATVRCFVSLFSETKNGQLVL